MEGGAGHDAGSIDNCVNVGFFANSILTAPSMAAAIAFSRPDFQCQRA
jgi:hypothetical protein